MRLFQSPVDAAILSAFLFPYLSSAAGNIDCTKVVAGDVEWNLEALGGPRSVMHSDDVNGQTWRNTTYTIDICRPLRLADKKPAEKLCPMGSRICAMERSAPQDPPGDEGFLDLGYPIAGELKGHGGGDLDAKWTRLSTSDSNEDSQKEGLLLNINGGFYVKDGKTRKTKAVVEFLCDKNREGTENLIDPLDKYLSGKEKRSDGIDSTKPKDGENEEVDPESSPLEFVSYDTDGDDMDILRLSWKTKHVCENAKDGKGAEKSNGWGFFTWFIIIAFLSTATYLIFGSWLNYNRYGARGWDLLPHGDAIRDVPYLLKDWTRRVLNTIQGGGSRGGYAAV